MSNRRTLLATVAVVLAAIAGIGVFMYASGADNRAASDAGFVEALVATSDIAKGTTGTEALQAGLVKMEKVAKSSVPPAIIADPDELVDRIAAGRIDTKQFITTQSFVDAEDGLASNFANALASKDMRAVSIQVDVERGVANQIAPGDHVDVASVVGADTDGNQGSYQYLLRNVKVLAVGPSTIVQQLAAGAATSTPVDATAAGQAGLLTFEVSPEDALAVIDANSKQKVYLVLRPPATTTGGGTAAPAGGR